jgi:flagellar motor switch/type III secretory pathway protein FliN
MKPAALQTLLAEQDIYLAEDNGTKWPMLMQVPVLMKVKIPLPGISLRELTVLHVGEVIVSEWPASEEVPLYASNVALSWGEFEVVDGAIAVRLTRLG